MYRSIKTIALYLCLSFSLISCKKEFLEFVPKGKLIATTVEDYQLLMNNNTFYNYNITAGWHLPMVMGDEMAANGANFNTTQLAVRRAFRWEPVIFDPTATDPALSPFLVNIYALNSIINEVMDAGGSDALKKSVQAEALATRAWIYFQLINFYGKPYVAAKAAQDPGFPIITEADINQNYFDRSNVQAVYDFIISDLKKAIESLPVQNGIRTRMSKPAAEAILGKVYLFMGLNAEALVQLNAAMADIASMQNGPRLYDYNVTFGPSGSFLPIGANGPAGPLFNITDYTESLVFKTFPNFNGGMYGNIGMLLTDEAKGLFDPSDLRLKFYTDKIPGPSGTFTPGKRLRKFVRYTRFGMELADLYMLTAECKARLNDLSGAVSTLEAFRAKRMPNATVPVQIAGDKNALIKFIIDERIREYAEEGYRWFDMRRLSVDPIFSGKVFTHSVYETNSTVTTITMDQPNRLVLRIPQSIMDANPDMPNNP